MLAPVLHFAEKPIFNVFQLDKSEVYLRKDNGKSQTHQVCSAVEGVGKPQGNFFKAVEEELYAFLSPSFPNTKILHFTLVLTQQPPATRFPF